LLVADDKALTGVYFTGQKYQPRIEGGWMRDARHAPLRQAQRELTEYFAGKRKRFTVKISPRGTPFQRAVWKAIAGVGFGRTIPYAELARRDRPQPDRHHRTLSPYRRFEWHTHRLRGWLGEKAGASGAGRTILGGPRSLRCSGR
jgi:hypothetical protein